MAICWRSWRSACSGAAAASGHLGGKFVHEGPQAPHATHLIELRTQVHEVKGLTLGRPCGRAARPGRPRCCAAHFPPAPPHRPSPGCAGPSARDRILPALRFSRRAPRKTMGLPVTSRTESAAPPRASPSALVRMMPVSSRLALKARAVLSASCPDIASTTNRRSWAFEVGVDVLQFLHQLRIDVQSPGRVHDQRVVHAASGLDEGRGGDLARRLCALGRSEEAGLDLPGQSLQLKNGRRSAHIGTYQQHSTPVSFDEPARQLGRRRGLARTLQAREQPAPRAAARSAKARFPPSPSIPTSSRCRIPIRVWPGLRLALTSVPSARALTASIKRLTTGRATSASSKAIRTSRSVSAMLSSVSRPRPRNAATAALRRPVS